MTKFDNDRLLPTGAAMEKSRVKTRRRTYLVSVLFTIVVTAYYVFPTVSPLLITAGVGKTADKPMCAQPEPLIPKSFDVSAIFHGQENRVVTWLSDAVKLPTEVFDEMGAVDEDPRWDAFYDFAEYLEEAFPLVHAHLNRTRVVTHALVYEWEGMNPSLKPLLLMGHQDTVPVLPATRHLWKHDPFGGEVVDGAIWGRGVSDDKSGVIGILSSLELLIESGKFRPNRTIILSFGIDEETGGRMGAYALGQWVEQKYGRDSIAMILDEGVGLIELWNQTYAQAAVGEKGYLDVEIKVETLGGHSSIPPLHSGIGLIARLIAALEDRPPFPSLNPESPLVTFLGCAAEYSPQMPSYLRDATRRLASSASDKDGKVDKTALQTVLDWYVEGSWKEGVLLKDFGRALVSTTQAIDIIHGGVKVNALPEFVSAFVNHRISASSSYQELEEHVVAVISPVAERYNLSLEAFSQQILPQMLSAPAKGTSSGQITISEAFNSKLNPAPVSPHTIDSAAWRVFSGTIKSVWNSRPEAYISQQEAEKTIEVAPFICSGNTDTKHFWALTRNIYRFNYQAPMPLGKFTNAHTVDEFVPITSYLEQVRFFATLMVNVDEMMDL